MKQSHNNIIKSFIFIIALSSLTVTAQARESLEALRNDLNAAISQINDQQTQINNLQTQVDGLMPTLYAIGDTGPAGGIVFYITDAGAHGLEAAPNDQGVGDWGCYGLTIVGADGTGIGTGAQNTTDILAGCRQPRIAAQLAMEYSWPNGQTDGYLPSKDELVLLYQQRSVVGGFANDYYWSSSEFNGVGAWLQYFANGNQFNTSKTSTFRVRAVRAF